MELAWGEDFAALADVSKSVFARYSPLEDRSNTVPFADQVAQFAELGWLQLGDPTGADADSPSLATIAGIFVEAGRALAATPLLELTMSRDAALVIGTDEATGLAKRIGNGEAVVVPVFPSPEWGSAVTYENGTLDGVALAVDHAGDADSFLVYAPGEESVVAVVEASSATAVDAMPNMGGYPMFAVTFDKLPLPDGAVLARGADADRAVEVAEQSATLAAIAELVRESLTPHQREVFCALALNGVPIDVLAERLATTRGALYKTLHDARRKLRAELQRQGFDTDGGLA